MVTQPFNSTSNEQGRQIVMRILLAAVLATVIVAPCMAANENQGDKDSGDALTPGVNEPRTPDTLKSNPDQRIRDEGRASAPEEKRELNDNNVDRK
jgi:hypothetical protein